MWRELAKYTTNLQLFQLFLHFLGHSSHCLCSRKTLFCCLDPRVQQTEGKEGLLVYITLSGWLVSVALSVFLYNCLKCQKAKRSRVPWQGKSATHLPACLSGTSAAPQTFLHTLASYSHSNRLPLCSTS